MSTARGPAVARSVSVVVNTYNRAESLRLTLAALAQLDHQALEVVVVDGPSTDDTEAVLAEYAGRIKTGRCGSRNLSESRNIGIRLAAGEIVAFIDDDAYPDPGWLGPLVQAYDDPEVAAAGGPVYNQSGFYVQAWSSFVDRLGNAWVERDPDFDIVPSICAPGSNVIPYTMGTNSSFRRDALVAVGGFDEEFEYYHDESDLCRRLVDAGYLVRPLDDGFVYHKFLPSTVRDEPDLVRDHYSIFKNKTYFALRHATGYLPFTDIAADLTSFLHDRTLEADDAAAQGRLSVADRATFDLDRRDGPQAGYRAFLAGPPRTRPAAWFGEGHAPFLLFPTTRPPGGKLHLCFLSQEYPPMRVNGIARVVHGMATSLARAGHVVRVLTRGADHPRIDLEDGVWVHRIPVAAQPPPAGAHPGLPAVPAHLWDYAASMHAELLRIHGLRPVDIVEAPNWDSEGIAALVDGRFRVLVSLHTPIATVARVDTAMGARLAGDDPTIRQMIDLDRYCYARADGILANSHAIVEEIESEYGITLGPERTRLVPHGVADRPATVRPATRPGKVQVLFVGRLEARKGIDTLLAAVPGLAERFPDVMFTVVGDDSLPSPSGRTYREEFEDSTPRWRGRVQFTGALDDPLLWRYYAGCDLLVAPSRYESFGLMVVEAMTFAKPVVAGAVGGMPEIVVDGETGLLVPPDDPAALAGALAALIESPERRTAMGAAGRARYESHFSLEAMAQGAEGFYRELLRAGRVPGKDLSSARS